MFSHQGTSQERWSSHRFQKIPDMSLSADMANRNDVTIDIPLASISSRSQTGARKMNSAVSPSGYQPPTDFAGTDMSEKADLVADDVPGSGPGRRRRVDSSGKSLVEPEDGTVTRMGRFYRAFLNFSIVTRYMLYVAPIALLIAVPIIVSAVAARHATIGGVRVYWFFAWIEVVWVSLWVSKAFAYYLPFVFQFLCGIVSSGTRKYALILRALEIPLSIVFWCVICLVSFLPTMTLNPAKVAEGDTGTKPWERTIKNILFGLLICSLIFMGEKTIVQLISISYHRKQFDIKIKQSKRNIYLIGQLYDASRALFPEHCKEFADEDAVISSILAQRPGHKRNNSTNPMRIIRNVGQNVGRIGDKVTAAFGNVAQEITGKQVFNPTAAHSIVLQALERKKASEALSRRIWMSFVVEGRDALYLEDIIEVLGAERQALAEECFNVLDRDGNGDISLDEMILTVAEFGRGRKALNHSMHDVDQAIRVLDNLLLTVAFIIGVLVFISFVTSGFGTVIAAGATTLLSLSFVFSTTAQEVLGSCIFLFVKHPFDVGDRVEVSDKPFIVERISLLFTVMRSITDHRITQVPNNVLNSLWVDNFTRANAMHEVLTIPVAFDTTFADVQMLRAEMEQFVRDKENCRDFQPDINIEVVGVGDMDKLQLSVDIRHKSNWSNETIRSARRSKFMCALVMAVRKIPMRAPGSSAKEEEKKADGDDKKSDAGSDKQKDVNRLIVTEQIINSGAGRSTGVDNLSSSGSLQHRGGSSSSNNNNNNNNNNDTHQWAMTAEQKELAYMEQLNARSPGFDESRDGIGAAGLTRMPSTASSVGGGHLSPVNETTPNREHFTGFRHHQDTLSPSDAQSYKQVPIIAEPTASGAAAYYPNSNTNTNPNTNNPYYSPSTQGNSLNNMPSHYQTSPEYASSSSTFTTHPSPSQASPSAPPPLYVPPPSRRPVPQQHSTVSSEDENQD
ncbi:hypothetical protein ASPZODRAFT_1977786 [Penicilliopsis zonata CBS 506.65]|uniref:EF-hand domain-containing protein n=1 Tax=Penicilliopsis zonata CBS 506.65 TaxID=1073090 RepID=A0A1L9SH59_9EURO|nr:hypothetical protein ASPZODRAFT_1977786 [Penicilliopsis zonata CBS 506.65]OJJ46590.1 hypothetical protein ASPZODRAFT_1977786 [Penicilliopsis zonata CBS 506.65]